MSRKNLFQLIQIIRNFFCEQGFVDVLTPPAVENPGMEVHIHPFQLYSVKNKRLNPLYLHTSPEFCMKELLASEEDFENIFTITYSFRDEPPSPIHRSQFLMLEWYRKGARYEKIMTDIEDLVYFILKHASILQVPLRKSIGESKIIKKTMAEIFWEELKVNILDYLDISSIKNLACSYKDIPVPDQDLDWDDYFFLIYLNKIEPFLKKYPLLIIYEFPAPLSALSTLKKNDSRVCERFELFINGIEVGNCFNELIDFTEQKRRFTEQDIHKRKLYHYHLPEPKSFYMALESGLPSSAGIAVGVERLLHTIFEVEEPFFY